VLFAQPVQLTLPVVDGKLIVICKPLILSNCERLERHY